MPEAFPFSQQSRDHGGAPTWSKRLYLRIRRRDIAYFKFILEACDNLGVMTVVDRYEAVLHLSYAPGREEELREFLRGMSAEIHLERVLVP